MKRAVAGLVLLGGGLGLLLGGTRLSGWTILGAIIFGVGGWILIGALAPDVDQEIQEEAYRTIRARDLKPGDVLSTGEVIVNAERVSRELMVLWLRTGDSYACHPDREISVEG